LSLRWKKAGTGLGPLDRAFQSTPEIAWVAFVAAFVVFLGSATLILHNGLTMRRVTEAREAALLEGGLRQRTKQLHTDITSATVWSEAYKHTAGGFDVAWAETNFGDYYHRYLNHNVTLGLGPDDHLAFAAVEGVSVAPESLRGYRDAVQALVAKARMREQQIVIKNPSAAAFDRLATAAGAFRVGDVTYIGLASTVVRDTGDPGGMLARAPMIVSAVRVDSAFLRELSSTFQLESARMSTTRPKGSAVVEIADASGKPLTFISWSPYRPGVDVIYQNRYYIGLLAILIISALIILLLRISRMAQSLVSAKEQAEEADLAKSAFLANMSHEIRTPLNGVLGMAQVMETDELSPRQRERVQVIRDSGAALLAILNDLLDLSKVQAGRLELEDAPFDIETVTKSVQAAFVDLAQEQGSGLVCNIDPAATGGWSGDALRIRQILSNLVSNAVKFTRNGVVTVTVSPTADGLSFEVRDTGIGIDAANLTRVFEKFSQEDVSTTRRFGGTGLGLSICRELVIRMGGQISVASEKDKGATFTFRLPLRRAEAPAPAAIAQPDALPERVLRILAAEDNATNQLVLRSLLVPLGAEIVMAADGREAVAAFEAAAFDIILMDVQMPEMNGVEATKAIRQIERSAGRPATPILALSANVMDYQIREYQAAGMNGAIAKPIVVEKLYEALGQALQPDTDASAAA